MNKTQIIAPLVLLLLVGLVLAHLHGKRNRQHFITAHVEQIGRDLISTTNSALLIQIGPHLKQKLAEFLGAPTQVADVVLGDEPSPIGDGKADGCLFLKNERNEMLGVRLRQDSASNSFHVLGFWTPMKATGAAK